MLHVSLHCLQQVWNLVVALLEQHVNVGPCAVVVVAQAHQLVVENNNVDRHADHQQKKRSFGHDAAVHSGPPKDSALSQMQTVTGAPKPPGPLPASGRTCLPLSANAIRRNGVTQLIRKALPAAPHPRHTTANPPLPIAPPL